MAGYPNQKQKTPGRAVRRFCLQTAASFGVFFLVLTLFQSTSPGSIPWKQWVRETFTADFDAAPVMEFFYQMDSPGEDAIQVDAPLYPVQETMAIPVNGKILKAGSEDIMQMSSRFEEGIWIQASADEPVLAAYSGTVTGLWEEAGLYTVELSHANGFVTIYGCCARAQVSLNEPVKKGQVLGYVTAQNTDGNFYFATRYLGESVSPMELLNQKADAAL